MKIFLCIFFLTIFYSSQLSAQDPSVWLPITEHDGIILQTKLGDFSRVDLDEGRTITRVLGRSINKKSSNTTFFIWAVYSSDCDRGMGRVLTFDVNYNFLYDSDFVISGGNLSSMIAEYVCYIEQLLISNGE